MRAITVALMSLTSLFSASFSFAQNNPASGSRESIRVFVSVSGEGRDQEWARKQCQLFHLSLNQTSTVSVTCDWNKTNDMLPESHRTARNSDTYDLYLESYDDRNGTTHLRAVNWHRMTATEFNQVGWQLEPSENYLANVQKLVNHVVQLKLNSEIYRTSILARLVKDSQDVEFNSKDHTFRERLTGIVLPLNVAESKYMGEGSNKKDYLTTALEIFAIMGVGQTWYTTNAMTMNRDWDYASRGESFVKILNGERVLFDDNGFRGTNWPHAYATVPEYLLCRANGFSLGESFLCSFTASMIWENIIEFREVFSINDQTTTSIGGLVIGESLFQLQRYFGQNRGRSPLNKEFSKIFSSPEKFNSYVQKNMTRGKSLDLSYDSLSRPLWGQAELFMEVGKRPADAQASPTRVGFDGQTISISGWNEAGRDSGFTADTATTELLFEDVLNSKKAGQDLHMMSKIAFAAWSQKRLSEDMAGRLTGYQFFVSPGSGVETRQNDTDFFGSINILGATAHLELFEKGTKITAEVQMYGDFAMVHSLSINDYKNSIAEQGLATVLQRNDYYYAVGTTTQGQVILEKNKWSVGASVASHDWNSVNGLYRFQSQVTNDVPLADKEQEASISVGYRITKNVQLSLSATTIRRKSNIGGQFEKTTTSHTTSARLSYLF